MYKFSLRKFIVLKMSQIFIGKDPRSLAVDIMAKYTRAVDADLVKVNEVTVEQQKVLGLATLPCMIVTEGDKTFKCSSPFAIFRHIAELTRFESIFLGRTEVDKQQILSYFEIVGNLEVSESAELINNDLTLRNFLVTYNITAADIFAYAHLVHYVQKLQDFEKTTQNNLFRWIDHLQHLPGIDKYVKTHNLTVDFPDENAKQPSKRELKKMAKKQATKEGKAQKQDNKEEKQPKQKQEKAQKPAPVEEEKKDLDASATTNDTKAAKQEKKQKQQNQPKPPKGGKKEPEPVGEPITQLDIRVGRITKVWKHPESEKLYCEEVDIGEEKPRCIASGLQKFVPIEKMENAMVIVLANLKAKKLAGYESHGMVMCAETPDKSSVELLVPPEGSKPGDIITIKGFERNPPAQLNPKKKILEAVIGDFKIDENGVAKYKDFEWSTENGIIVSEGIRNGIIA
jgi:aminoacyl tRNA synthase complex-interacting multifunctional protein 1